MRVRVRGPQCNVTCENVAGECEELTNEGSEQVSHIRVIAGRPDEWREAV